ncbi:helicase-associated domain-containing protein [Actinopolymorpha singaporensis]|uniref:Helicase conserved C-terminal domain-containing protein n=1 Tax=Actinopolymorpha singaporensis TaxID=117157 RepID=A0A1H1LIG4_9ACTN|nr:helicase-associated domain-containing protein [Actinopolymorpha singaporensis]SDR73805.1 Helicase conserved C-terminal domain-containing protein [Actinopolymorpha singaporensis]
MPRSTSRPATLPETLRGFDDDALAELFRNRPDLMTPLPSDLAQLATRSTTRSSLARTLDQLDRRALAVLEAFVVLPRPASEAEVRALAGLPDPRVKATLAQLRGLALVWGPRDALEVPVALADLLGPYPAGLGPPAEHDDLADGERIAALLAEAGPEARAVAERLAAGPPVGIVTAADRPVTVETARTPVERLRARGLLNAADARSVVLPREVGLHLRGGRLYPAEQLAPPTLDGPSRDPALVDRTAAGTTLEVVRQVEQLLDAWGADPPPVLRAGGLGVRDLRRTAGVLGVSEPSAALLLETAFAAGLVAVGEDDSWLPTPAYDTWLALDTEHRWARLATAWLDSPRVPALVGTRDERDRPRQALSAELERSVAPGIRRLVLAALADPAAGTAPSTEAVTAWVRWRRPRRMTAFVEQLVAWTLEEASAWGVTGLGALAGHGRALVSGAASSAASAEEAAAAELGPHLPAPVDHVLLQADLTAVAPGPLRPDLARSLAAMADAESHGGATVYRFTETSVRRALDAGRTAAELHELLVHHSATPVPQPLSYLVDDVARRHGHLRAGSATAYLRCDDPALLDAVLADRRTAALGLRRIAPTVVVARQPVRALVDELRSLGFSPVPETADGALMLSETRVGRTAETPQRAPVTAGSRTPEPEVLAAAVRAVRAGDRARASRPAGATVGQLRRTPSGEAVDVLRAALAGGWSVWMGYVDQQGGALDRIVDPVRIDGGWLTAYDHAAGEARTFALHRITGAAPVD